MPNNIDAQTYAQIIYTVLSKEKMTPQQIIQAQFGELRRILRNWVEKDEKYRIKSHNDIITNFRARPNTLNGKFIEGYFNPLLNIYSNEPRKTAALNDILQLFLVACSHIDGIVLQYTSFADELFHYQQWERELTKKQTYLSELANQASIASELAKSNEQLTIEYPAPIQLKNIISTLNLNLLKTPSRKFESKSNITIAPPDTTEKDKKLYNFLTNEKHMDVASILASQLFQLEQYLNGYKKIFENNPDYPEASLVLNKINQYQKNFDQALRANDIPAAFNTLYVAVEGYLSSTAIIKLSPILEQLASPQARSWEQESQKIKHLFEFGKKEMPSEFNLIDDRDCRKAAREWQRESENAYDASAPTGPRRLCPGIQGNNNNNSSSKINITPKQLSQNLSALKRKESPNTVGKDTFEAGNRSPVYQDELNNSPVKKMKPVEDTLGAHTGATPRFQRLNININTTELTLPVSPSKEDDDSPTPPYQGSGSPYRSNSFS